MSVSCQPARTQPGPAYATDCTPAASTQTVPALPVPTQSVHTRHTPTQAAVTFAQHTLAMPVHAMHECTPAMPVHTMSQCAPTMSRPVMLMNEYASAVPGPECTLTMPRPVVNEHAPSRPHHHHHHQTPWDQRPLVSTARFTRILHPALSTASPANE